MKEVTIGKAELLNTLKRNKKVHVDDYDKVMAKHMDKLMEIYQQGLDELADDKIPNRKIPHKPISHEDDYDRNIKMIEMSVDDVFTLTEMEFQQLILDEWSWRQEFEFTKSTYGV